MKKVEIRKFSHAEVDAEKETFGFLKVPAEHKLIRAEGEDLEVSDGFHTFDELYDHRVILFIALCKHVVERGVLKVWKSKSHHDGKGYDGWFIMGINIEAGEQISYHLPMDCWEQTEFVETLETAPEWDGHTSNDVLERLKNL